MQMKRHTAGRWQRSYFRVGKLVFCDPLPACMLLYLLLYFDSSCFLRIGLLAAFLHECGHIAVYCRLFHSLPRIEVTMTGFCMRTSGKTMTTGQTLCLAAAGPATNLLLAGIWYLRIRCGATLRSDAFLAANLLTGMFNLIPIEPLDGAKILDALTRLGRGLFAQRER